MFKNDETDRIKELIEAPEETLGEEMFDKFDETIVDRILEPGDIVYVGNSFYMDHGEDDVVGGLAAVTKVINDNNIVCINVYGHPGYNYNWNYLKDRQRKLREEFGRRAAKPDPDYD